MQGTDIVDISQVENGEYEGHNSDKTVPGGDVGEIKTMPGLMKNTTDDVASLMNGQTKICHRWLGGNCTRLCPRNWTNGMSKIYRIVIIQPMGVQKVHF